MQKILLITDNVMKSEPGTLLIVEELKIKGFKIDIFNINKNTFPKVNQIKKYKFVFNRLDKYTSEIKALFLLLKTQKNKVLNKNFELTNNKFLTTTILENNNIKVIKTENINNKNYKEIIKKIKLPMVIKGTEGYCGNQVYKADTEEEVKKIINNEQKSIFLIAQPYIDSNNTDYRVINIKGEAIVTIKRQNEKDFRANISLGGNYKIEKTEKELKKISKEIMNILNMDMLGIDFIYDGKDFLFCEANNCFGIANNKKIAKKIVTKLLM